MQSHTTRLDAFKTSSMQSILQKIHATTHTINYKTLDSKLAQPATSNTEPPPLGSCQLDSNLVKSTTSQPSLEDSKIQTQLLQPQRITIKVCKLLDSLTSDKELNL